jgi:hypothetical protein
LWAKSHQKQGVFDGLCYDPASEKLDIVEIIIDKEKPPSALTKDDAILNWEVAALRAKRFSPSHQPDGSSLLLAELSDTGIG